MPCLFADEDTDMVHPERLKRADGPWRGVSLSEVRHLQAPGRREPGLEDPVAPRSLHRGNFIGARRCRALRIQHRTTCGDGCGFGMRKSTMLIHVSPSSNSAFLLFPRPTRHRQATLPWFGGSAAVWTTCLVFFQCALLAGHFYPDWTAKTDPKQQAILHVVLVVIALALCPSSPMPRGNPRARKNRACALPVAARRDDRAAVFSVLHHQPAGNRGLRASSKARARTGCLHCPISRQCSPWWAIRF